MHPRNALFVLALTAATGATAHAQTPQLPRHDATISVGWFGQQYPGLERYDRWHQSLLSGAGVGRYWTAHLKSEVEASWLSPVAFESGESTPNRWRDGLRQVQLPIPGPEVSLGQSYQFGVNAWVHRTSPQAPTSTICARPRNDPLRPCRCIQTTEATAGCHCQR